MPDTARQLSDLQSLFADNTTQEISPQDLRDFLVTAIGCYAQIYVTGGSTAQSSIGTGFTPVTGFTTNGADAGISADAANDRITLDVAGVYQVGFQVSFSGSASTLFTFSASLDGTEETQCSCARALGTGGDTGSCSFVGLITATAGQQLTVEVKADGSSKSITPAEMQLVAKLVG